MTSDIRGTSILDACHPRHLEHAARRAPSRTQRESEHETRIAQLTAMRISLSNKWKRNG
jgi:hypothetical protein